MSEPQPVRHVMRPVWHCHRCGHEWVGYMQDAPKQCSNPKCRSPYYATPRRKPKPAPEATPEATPT